MRKQRGFTLLEVIVASAIFSMMMLLVFMILQGGVEQVRVSEGKMNLQEATRESLYRISYKLRAGAPSRICIDEPCKNTGSIIRFCTPNPQRPINILCTQNCEKGSQCPHAKLADCVNACNAAWDANWKGICKIDCNTACVGFCNSDSSINWKDALQIRFAVNNGQLIRTETDLITGVTSQTVEANDIQNVTFTANGNPISTIGLSVTARRTLINGRILSVDSGSEVKIRNP